MSMMQKKATDKNKVRKTVEGSVRSKERTKQKLIDAIGKVLKEKRHVGLYINNIVKKAGIDRRLISLYFGNVNNIEDYPNRRDYCMINNCWMIKWYQKYGLS